MVKQSYILILRAKAKEVDDVLLANKIKFLESEESVHGKLVYNTKKLALTTLQTTSKPLRLNTFRDFQ